MPTVLVNMFHAALPAVLVGLCGLLVNYVLPKLPGATQHLFDWVKGQLSHVKNAYAQGLLNRALVIVNQVVLAFENTEVEDIKARVAAGLITKDQLPMILRDLKANAVAAVKDHMNLQGILQDVQKIVFSGEETGLMKWVETAIEAAVSQLAPSGLQTPKAPGAATAVAQGQALTTMQMPPSPK
jgi:hypothetical protein